MQVIVDQIVFLDIIPQVVFQHVLILEANPFWVDDSVLLVGCCVSRLQLNVLVYCAFSLIY